ncbi:MAG TPA: rhomboid family intramembrane serine protease [Ilumatobacteraceae bacterium]|nr:rhomboid family intramembrane serine protease [Ilumatobacteraceae bacterium]
MSTTEPALPRCYRHPDRETGRNCTRCGKPACGDCLVQAAVGSHCLDCAKAARPDARTRAKLATSSVLTPVTYAIIGLNVLVFLWMGLQDSHTFSGNLTEAHYDLGLNKLMLRGVAPNWNMDGLVPDHQWYRLVTSGFIHFGLFHIAMNMLLLFQLGQLLERALGGVRFAMLYGASLLAGSLGVLLLDPNGISGGASGAVFGLMAGAAIGLHRRGVNVFNTGIGTTLALNLVLTFTIRGISIGGHLGGAVAGAICGWVMLAPSWRPAPKWATYALPAGVMAASVLLSMAVVG